MLKSEQLFEQIQIYQSDRTCIYDYETDEGSAAKVLQECLFEKWNKVEEEMLKVGENGWERWVKVMEKMHSYIKYLTQENPIITDEVKQIEIFHLDIQDDPEIFEDWAKQFRRNYCSDDELFEW